MPPSNLYCTRNITPRALAAYERATGVTVHHLGPWDALAGAPALVEGDGWVDAWTEVGVP